MYQYPYGDYQQLNLDWIINKIVELENQEAGDIDLEEISNAMISLTYSSTQAYNISDVVFYDGHLYRCNTAISAPGETWDPAHWDQIMLGDTVANLVRAVAGMSSDDVSNESNVAGTHVTEALNALVEDVRYDNHKIQQKKNGAYTDVIPVEDTPSNNSDRLASSKAAYDLKSALTTNNLPVNPCIKEAKLIAHQGSTSFVQSTDLCFKNAIMQGFKILEGDVQKTSDNKFVIWHDSTVGGLTVASSTLAQIQALTLDYGCKVLSLEDFVKLAIENSIAVELDLSVTHFSDANFTTYAQNIYNTVKAINPSMDSVIWTINYAKALVLETIDPSVMICYSGLANVGAIGDNVKRLVKNSRLFMFSQNKSTIAPDVVAWSHNNGVLIKAYTITTETELFNAIASGADKVISEAILPTLDKYIYVLGSTEITQYIYDERVSLNSDVIANGFRLFNNNIGILSFNLVMEKTLSATQRSMLLLPQWMRPATPIRGICFAGDTGNTAATPYSCDVTQTGYLNITHNGQIAIGKHMLGTLMYPITPPTTVFPDV